MTGARGEGLIEFDGERHAILFTNRALAEAERALRQPMLQLVSGLEQQRLGIGDIAQLLQIGLEHGRREAKNGRRPYNDEDVYRYLDAIGFTTATRIVLMAIVAVLAYGAGEAQDDSPPA